MLRRLLTRLARRPLREKKTSPEKFINRVPLKIHKRQHISSKDIERLNQVPFECFERVQLVIRDTNSNLYDKIKLTRETSKRRNEQWKDNFCMMVKETWDFLLKETERCAAKNKFMIATIEGVARRSQLVIPTVETWKHDNPAQAIALNEFELRLSRLGWIPKYGNMDPAFPERVSFCCDFSRQDEEEE